MLPFSPAQAQPRTPIGLVRWACAATAFALVGCAQMKSDWAYRQIVVGTTTQSQALAMLPAPAKSTTVSVTCLQGRETPPSRDAVVILVDESGTVTGKARVKAWQEHYGVVKKGVTSFELILQPDRLGQMIDEGPVARLRDVYDLLEKKQYDRLSDQAHALVCAAILRTLEAMPDVVVKPSHQQRFADVLAAIPPNGAVEIRTLPGKRYEIRYDAESQTMGKIVFPDATDNDASRSP